MKRQRVIIFGASQRGMEVLRQASKHFEVIGFADNDSNKNGTIVAGLPVFAPCTLPSLRADYIIVASMHSPMITRQLQELGITANRIRQLGESKALPAYDFDACSARMPFTHTVCAVQEKPELYTAGTVVHSRILDAAMSGNAAEAIGLLAKRLDQRPNDPMLKDTMIRVAGINNPNSPFGSKEQPLTTAWNSLTNRWKQIAQAPLHPHRPLVSVIVPIYNVEPYLPKCLDSLVNQTLSSIEIIVVDDDSPDNSRRIVERLRQAHPDKIKYFHKENGGLSSARNYGIKQATGAYIGFVDGDDYVEESMFAHLFDCIHLQQLQIACGQYYHYPLSGGITLGGSLLLDDHQVYHGRDFLLNTHVMAVWNKLYNRPFIQDIPFPSMWFEDIAWTPVIMSRAERIGYIPMPLYHYVQRPGSIVSSDSDPRTLQGIDAIRHALRHSQPDERDAVLHLAMRRLLFEIERRPQYADHYVAALRALAGEAFKSTLIQSDRDLIDQLDKRGVIVNHDKDER